MWVHVVWTTLIEFYFNNMLNMKKFLICLSALFLTVPTFAQSDDGDDDVVVRIEKSNAFFIGPKVGGTLSTMSDPDECDLYDGSGISLSGGIAMKVRFGRATSNSAGGTGYFGVGVELKYSQKSMKTVGIDEEGEENAKLNISYFEVPVYVQVYPFAKNSSVNTLYVELGAAVAGTLSRSPKTLMVNNPNDTYDSVVYHLDDGDSKLSGMDIRPLVGIGYTIPGTGFDINARYYLGMSELAENFACKINNFEVSLAWMFNIGKF